MRAPENVTPYWSVVVPVRDEEASIEPLYEEIVEVAESIGHHFEVIIVDDGSVDGSWQVIEKLVERDPERVAALRLRRSFGKAQALAIGFDECRGEIVLTMDGDLQDDPAEIPRFLEELDKGYDVVSGWKLERRDSAGKRIASKAFNLVTARLSGLGLHDFNCGFKAYKREVLEELDIYGELHRFIPLLAGNLGYRVGEMVVTHRPRRFGSSKYGAERFARGALDLLTVLATTRYLNKPAHLFGGIGIASAILGGIILAYLAVLWGLELGPVGTRPLFFVGILLVILSVQLISLGVVAELLTRHLHTLDADAFIRVRRTRDSRSRD